MNLKKIFVVIILVLILMSACSAKPEELYKSEFSCPYTLKYVVTDMADTDIQVAEIKTTYRIDIEKSDNYNGQYENYMVFDDESAIGEAEYNLSRKIINFNNLIAPYFGGDITDGAVLLQTPRFTEYYNVYRTLEPYACIDGDYKISSSLEENAGIGDYPISTRYYDGRIYVTATSPKGSTVSYSFPQAVINRYFNHYFNGGASVAFPNGSNIVSNEVTADTETFTLNMLQNLIGNGNSVEAVYFSFTADDMEGRRILKPLIARALAITSGENQNTKYVAVLNGYNYNGQKSVASLTLENHGTSVRSYGFGSGLSVDGAETNLNYNNVSTMEDMVSGSIYLVPLQ
jgi:hypothetical protein